MAFFPGVQERTTKSTVGPVTYYDSVAGSGDPGTIVLLHGTGGSAENNFSALYPMLAMSYRVVALDFVDPLTGEVTLDHYVAQAAAVLEQCAPDAPVTLVGYSFGAAVAVQLAADRPDLLDRLVLVAGWIRTDQHQLLRNDLWSTLRQEQHPMLGAFMVFTGFSATYLLGRTPAELEALIIKTATGPDRAVKMALNRDIDLTDAISHISADTLVVGCTDDLTVPIHHSRALFGGIERARYAEIPAGHAVVHERPAQLARLIQTFIEDPAHTPVGATIATGHA